MAVTVTHSTVVNTPDDATSDVGSNEWNSNHTVTGLGTMAEASTANYYTSAQVDTIVSGLPTVRTRLAADTNFYVRSDGNDSNTGLVNTAGGAWLTIQKAANYICSSLDFAGYNCALSIGAGTFNGADFIGPVPGGGNNTDHGYLDITGAGVGSTFIRPNSGFSCALYFRGVIGSGIRMFGGFEFLPSGGTFKTYLRFTDEALCVTISANLKCQGDVTDYFMRGSNVGYAEIAGTLTIAGSMALVFYIFTEFNLYISSALTLTGTPNIPEGFAYIDGGSTAYFDFSSITGTATGKKFDLFGNSHILTKGLSRNLNFLPGSIAGTAEDGCTYDGEFLNLCHAPIVFANRPATPVKGHVCCFTDSNTAVHDATIAGGGVNNVLGWYDGTNWKVVTGTSAAGSQTPWTGTIDANGFNLGFDDATGILDDSGNEQLIFQKTASALNYLEITNGAATVGSTDGPSITAAGGSTNVNMNFAPKGASGQINFNAPFSQFEAVDGAIVLIGNSDAPANSTLVGEIDFSHQAGATTWAQIQARVISAAGNTAALEFNAGNGFGTFMKGSTAQGVIVGTGSSYPGAGSISAEKSVHHVAGTFANRPGTPVAGMVCYFTDSTTATWGATIAGGAGNKVLGWYNGTNWTVVGA